MIDLMHFEALLKGKHGAGFDGVGGALEFADIGKGLGRGVWAYIIPDRDTSEPSRGTQRIEQRVTQGVIVALYIPTSAATRGGDTIKQYHDAAVHALLGWTPPGIAGATAFEYGGAALNSIQAGSVIWAQRWSYSFYIRKDLP